jgi:hypothetical protein
MDLQKQDGDIRPILCEEIWRRCFSSLAVNAMPVRNEEVNLLTSTYDHIVRRSSRFSMITLIHRILMIPK